MMAIIVLSALAIVGMLIFFRWRLRRGQIIRKNNDFALGITCAVAVEQAQVQRKTLSAQMTKAELASRKAAEKSRDPDTAGHSRISVVIVLVLFSGSLFALLARPNQEGGDPFQSIAHANTTAGGVNTVNIPDGASGGRVTFDAKLAELRSKPTLANVTWFRVRPLTERRQEIIDAMRAAANNAKPDVAQAAQVTLHRWEK